MKLPVSLSFPLIARELTESAARPRTYWIRVVYGAALYGLFFLFLSYLRDTAGSSSTSLGIGWLLIVNLTALQLFGLLIFQPALISGGITYEKERESMALLFLSRMSPSRILLEKFFAGMFPMGTLLLLALPLGGVCMIFGGVSTDLLFNLTIVILVAWFQIGSIGLYCSARFHTSVGAFTATYVIIAALYSIYPICQLSTTGSWETNRLFPGSLLNLLDQPNVAVAVMLKACWGVVGSGLVFLVMARVALVRNWERSVSERPVWNFFTKWWRVRWKYRAKVDLPDQRPIAWRESSRSWMASPEQRVYALSISLTCVATLCMFASGSRSENTLVMFMTITGILTALLICIRSANSMVSERVAQTLEVLLTTPISTQQIIKQKTVPVIRFGIVSASHLAVIYGFFALDRVAFGGAGFEHALYCWGLLTAMTLMFVRLIAWISMACGIVVKNRLKVVLVAFGIFVGWSIVGLVAARLLIVYVDREVLRLMSPGGFLITVVKPQSISWKLAVCSFVYYEAIILAVRSFCLRKADHFLRR